MQNMHKTSGCLAALALIFSAFPQTADATWRFGAFVRGGLNWYGMNKVKIKQEALKSMFNGAPRVNGAGQPLPFRITNEADYETEAENFGRMLSGSIGFLGLYSINDILSFGGILELGLSFGRDKIKGIKFSETLNEKLESYLSEGFFAKLGLAIGITEWFMITAGLRASYVTNSFENNTGNRIAGAPRFDINYSGKSISESTWAFGLFGDLNLLIPFTSNLKGIVTIGLHANLNDLEFEHKDAYKGTDVSQVGVPIGWLPISGDLKQKVGSRLGLHAGIGLMWTF